MTVTLIFPDWPAWVYVAVLVSASLISAFLRGMGSEFYRLLRHRE